MGILFQRHTMYFPNDERVLQYAIYREDMIAQLMHGDPIKTTQSRGLVWNYDERIPLSTIKKWKDKIVYDYNLTIEQPMVVNPKVSEDNKYFRFDITYGDVKFLQLVAPTDAIKKFFYNPVSVTHRCYSVIQLINNGTFVLDEVVQTKLITDQVLKHGKDGDGNMFEPHVGMNAYVDLNLRVANPENKNVNRPFILKARVYLKTISIINDNYDYGLASMDTLSFIVNDMTQELIRQYGSSNFIS
jgi:hypothetical protein